ncbi:BamA/TamA family outer membrane protein [Flammeovirga aprica]|uniref:BamA/TamA family outer membrane protein n=1 Tax=Flammeovirga aprica JL-4 TaxID=694437 RepID=A0A7X9S174_9BACT|nr:BamA/TamA family outer membrane protein [Flammeovirga aprica]NME72469.1 BamA/TamA family outer membrane protein [Flammeovirga aprica JL-4]
MNKNTKYSIHNKQSRAFFLSALLLLFISVSFAQTTSYTVQFDFIDQQENKPTIQEKAIFNTIAECKNYSENLLYYWRTEGYFMASIDSAFTENTIYMNKVFLGPKSEEIKINIQSVNPQILKGKYWRGNSKEKWVKLKDLNIAKEQVVTYYENQGYPFTSVSIDSIGFDGKNLTGVLDVNLGDAVVLDTLIVKRNTPLGVHKKFFESYLGLEKGETFRQRNVDKATVILEETPYLRLINDPDVVFEYGKAMVEIPLEKRKASRADGMLGMAPNGQNEGELLITGQILLDLWNPFGTGKRFFIDWKRPDNDSQWFNAKFEYPRLFRSTIDFVYDINLQQQDSTFLRVDNSVQIKKRVSTRGSLSLGASWKSSRILRELNENDVDTLNDTQSILYSIGYKWQNLDNPISPRRGWRYELMFTGGQRNIIFNPALPSDVYEGIPQNSSLLQWYLEAEYYFGISKWLEGYLKVEGAQMLGDNLFKNELFRLGGFRSLRGFNEGELFIDRYAYFTFEPRINMGDQSFLFLFTDIGVAGLEEKWDFPMGIGAGINISTASGDFSIAYALGRTNDIPFSTQLAKIHFGFIGKF